MIIVINANVISYSYDWSTDKTILFYDQTQRLLFLSLCPHHGFCAADAAAAASTHSVSCLCVYMIGRLGDTVNAVCAASPANEPTKSCILVCISLQICVSRSLSLSLPLSSRYLFCPIFSSHQINYGQKWTHKRILLFRTIFYELLLLLSDCSCSCLFCSVFRLLRFNLKIFSHLCVCVHERKIGPTPKKKIIMKWMLSNIS